MPHIPGHITSVSQLPSTEDVERRRLDKITKKGLTRARGIIGEQETALLGRQEEATADFRRRLQTALRGQLGAVGRQTTQAVARRGLTGSGIEQAAQQAVSAAGQQGFAQSLGEFQGKLQDERARFGERSFAFLASIATLASRTEFEKELLRFQAQIAADAQKGAWISGIISSGVQVIAPFLKDDKDDDLLLAGGT